MKSRAIETLSLVAKQARKGDAIETLFMHSKNLMRALHPDSKSGIKSFGITPEDIKFVMANHEFLDYCRANPELYFREARTNYEALNAKDTPWDFIYKVFDHIIDNAIFSPAHQDLTKIIDAELNDRILMSRSKAEDLEIKLKVLGEVYDRIHGTLKDRTKLHIDKTKGELEDVMEEIKTLEIAKKVLLETITYETIKDDDDGNNA